MKIPILLEYVIGLLVIGIEMWIVLEVRYDIIGNALPIRVQVEGWAITLAMGMLLGAQASSIGHWLKDRKNKK